MTETKKTTLGMFFPPLWLLGAGALGAAALCVYIGAGVLDAEERRTALEASLEEHRHILESMPRMKQEFADLEKMLTEARAQKEALESSLTALRAQEKEIQQLLAQRDSVITQRDEAARTLQQFQKQQSALLQDKAQAEQEKLTLESRLTRLRGELPGLQASVEKARNELADLQARTQAQQKLQDLVRQEQKTLDGFSSQIADALRTFSSAVDNMTETGKRLSTQGTSMAREAESMAAARTAMQQQLDDAIRALGQMASSGTTARQQAETRLNRQLQAMATAAEEFSRQLAAGQKGTAAMTDAMRSMQQRMAAADRPLQDVIASAATLEQLHGLLVATLRDVQELRQQLEERAARGEAGQEPASNMTPATATTVSPVQEPAGEQR